LKTRRECLALLQSAKTNSTNTRRFTSGYLLRAPSAQTSIIQTASKQTALSTVFLLAFFLFMGSSVMAQTKQPRVRAPELNGHRGWLNTDKPLSLAALKGKVVLLDFWTYGCINCIHIIPELKKLEAKYPNQLVVIGVHSAKFENEKDTNNIRKIILRYEIEHPVVNDADFNIWNAYTVNAWPTRVLIDPVGYIIGYVRGEGQYETVDQVIADTITDFRKRGELNEQPLKLALEKAKVGDLPLAFPGKILADEKSNRLFIADSNHNRIVVTKLDGTLIETIGNGKAGSFDGSFEKAKFNRPQGMALNGDFLYVADTSNHTIRRVNLKTKTVETIAGTGKQAGWREEGGTALSSNLSSPWDLQIIGRTLFIAMAGPHQIWQMDLDKQTVSVFAGSGAEARSDGSLDESAFAQPSGITTDGKRLFIADSESNIIRLIDPSRDSVETLVGGNLFDFGDVDGEGDDVRLQHPLGVLVYGDKVLIADTYNHKIKLLDPQERKVKTFLGTGKPRQTDGAKSSFYEPAGLTIANEKLYIADTNNHAIRVVDLKTKLVSTLKIVGLTPPMNESVADDSSVSPNAEKLKTEKQILSIGNDGKLIVDVKLPSGYHLNPNAPQRLKADIVQDALIVSFEENAKTKTIKPKQLPLNVPIKFLKTGAAELSVQLSVYYCREDNTGECKIKTLAWQVPIEVIANDNTKREIKLSSEIKSDR
jgi:thiol-disulfide isomerase/thioredoxin